MSLIQSIEWNIQFRLNTFWKEKTETISKKSSQAMQSEQRTLKKMSFTSGQWVGYERFSYTPKKDIEPVRSSFRPGAYHFVVEWQMEEEVGKSDRQNRQ